MIGYVMNAFGAEMGVLDEATFRNLVGMPHVARTIDGVRHGREELKRSLPAFIPMGVPRETGLQRRVENVVPSGLFMLDFDDLTDAPQTVYAELCRRLSAEGIDAAAVVALAHVTPSGRGLRVVMAGREGSSIPHDLEWMMHLMEGCAVLDPVVKDLARLSFVPSRSDLLYCNAALLFGPRLQVYDDFYLNGQPLARDTARSIADVRHQAGESQSRGESALDDPQLAASFISALETQLGFEGTVTEGCRNQSLYTLARYARQVLGDDVERLYALLPDYGLGRQECMATLRSAVSKPAPADGYSTVVQRALTMSLEQQSCEPPIANPQCPTDSCPLPPLMELVTRNVPDECREAVAEASFAALAAHLTDVKFHYVDGKDYEPSLLTVIVAPMASGKSSVIEPIEHLMADIRERDLQNRQREAEWKRQCNVLAPSQARPERPSDMPIQIVSPNMTFPAMLQRLEEAQGRTLFTIINEIEQLGDLRTSSGRSGVEEILRLAFDRSPIGAERVGIQSVTASTTLRWNFVASTTMGRACRFFRGRYSDGTLSRISFATIHPREDGSIPMYVPYTPEYDQELKPYIDLLNNCHGTVCCPQAEQLIQQMAIELHEEALLTGNNALEALRKRALLIGFYKALILYISNGYCWTDDIAHFTRQSIRYCLTNTMELFADIIAEDERFEQNAGRKSQCGGRTNLLEKLGPTFTRQDAILVRRAEHMSDDPSDMLRKWIHRGYVVRNGDATYSKTALYLNRQNP